MDQKKYATAREGIVAWVSDCLKADSEPRGFFTHISSVDRNDEHTVYCFAPPDNDSTDEQKDEYLRLIGVALAKEVVGNNTKEVFFIQDRHARSNQGTTLDSVVTVYHWLLNVGWECGVIEYASMGPVQVKEVVWNNDFWVDAMKKELSQLRLGSRSRGREISLADFISREWDFPNKEESKC